MKFKIINSTEMLARLNLLFAFWESREFDSLGDKPRNEGKHQLNSQLFKQSLSHRCKSVAFNFLSIIEADIFQSVRWSWRTNAKSCNRLVNHGYILLLLINEI